MIQTCWSILRPTILSTGEEIPEDGAGDVLQPSWDGDSFTALSALGSQLIAFKRGSVWRVMGTDPGSYVFKEQYGGGTPCPQTVAVDGTRILMLGSEGVMCYDGEHVAPFYQEYAGRVFERVNKQALSEAAACMWKGSYYCALPLDDSPVNNAVLIFNTRENTWLLRTGLCVESFLPAEEVLWFTSSQTPGCIWQWQEDCMKTGAACPMRWMTGWQDLGRSDVTKCRFRLYLTAECQQETALRLKIETENRTSIKHITIKPRERQRCIGFRIYGRRFRLILESDGSQPWQLTGGMQLEMDVEEDG